MLKIVLLSGYLWGIIYHVLEVYKDSEIRDKKDFRYILGVMVSSILWPLIYIVMFICGIVDGYYDTED